MIQYYYDDVIHLDMLKDRNMRLQTTMALDYDTPSSLALFEDRPLYPSEDNTLEGEEGKMGVPKEACLSLSSTSYHSMGSSSGAYKFTGHGDGESSFPLDLKDYISTPYSPTCYMVISGGTMHSFVSG